MLPLHAVAAAAEEAPDTSEHVKQRNGRCRAVRNNRRVEFLIAYRKESYGKPSDEAAVEHRASEDELCGFEPVAEACRREQAPPLPDIRYAVKQVHSEHAAYPAEQEYKYHADVVSAAFFIVIYRKRTRGENSRERCQDVAAYIFIE